MPRPPCPASRTICVCPAPRATALDPGHGAADDGAPRRDVVRRAIAAGLMLLPVARGDARLVCKLQDAHARQSACVQASRWDADSGAVWTRFDWVSSDQYKVYPRPVRAPITRRRYRRRTVDGRSLIPRTSWPRCGWHDVNGAPGAGDVHLPHGNNVHAYEDSDNNNVPPAPARLRRKPQLRVCDRFDGGAIDLSARGGGQPVYWNNIIHDVQYQVPALTRRPETFRSTTTAAAASGTTASWPEAKGSASSTVSANFSTPPDGGAGACGPCGRARPRTRMGTSTTASSFMSTATSVQIDRWAVPATTSCLPTARHRRRV